MRSCPGHSEAGARAKPYPSTPTLTPQQGAVPGARTSGAIELSSVEGVTSIAWVPDRPDLLVAG